MAQTGGSDQNADLYFSAELQDNVSPTADQIEKRLKQLGASKSEIKMFLTAYDQATPKIKAAQDQLNKLPKNHMINVQTNADEAHKKLSRLRQVAEAPITISVKVKDDFDNYINKFKQRAHSMEFELKNSIRNTPLFAGLLGASGTAFNAAAGPASQATGLPFSSLGAGAGAFGAVGAMGAFFAKSFQANSQLEQNMARLTQILGGSAPRAQQAYGQVVNTSLQTPFNQQDVLGAYIQLAQTGTNPNHPVFGIKQAANLGAGAQVPIQQSQGALQAASLGYFQQLNNLTGRNIRQQDFTYGGRYSGETYQDAIKQVMKQYQNASETQMHTFKGLMTNIQDTFMQKLIMPAGAPLFGQAKGLEQQAAGKIQDPATVERMSNAVTKIQEGLIKVFDYVRRGAGYFRSSLEEPLKQIGESALKVGRAFAEAFGGTVVSGVKILSQAFTTILTPIAKITAAIPGLGNVLGFLKAIHMMGISTSTGVGNILGGLGHLNPLRMLEGFKQAGSLVGKVALFELVKGIMDAKNANDQLDKAFQNVSSSGSSAVEKLKVHFDALIFKANALNKSVNQLKTFGATAANILGPSSTDPTGRKLSKGAVSGALDMAKLSDSLGMNDSDTKALETTWGKQLAIGRQVYQQGKDPGKAFDDMTRQIYTSAQLLSKTLGISLKDAAEAAVTALSMFKQELAGDNMANPRGASAAAALLATASRPGAMSAKDILKFGGPQGLTSQLLQNAATPTSDVLHAALTKYSGFLGMGRDPSKGLHEAFSFKSDQPFKSQNLEGVRQILDQYGQIPASSARANAAVIKNLGLQGMPGVNLPQFQNVMNLPTSQGGVGLNLNMNQLKNMNTTQAAQELTKLPDIINNTQKALQNVNTDIVKTQDDMQRMAIATEQAQAALASFTLRGSTVMGTSIEKLQDHIERWQINLQKTQNAMMPLERAIAGVQQQMADYEHNSILPIQRAQEDWNQVMVRTSNHLEDVSFALGKAQFEMGKFHDGMLKGENALQDQIHALGVYNQKLDMLRLQNMGLQADLSKTQFHQGFTSTVKPLMGFDLAREIQLGQEKAQLKQDEFDTTYGDRHYKLDRAARPLFQRMEMGFGQRMSGILEQRKIIDTSTLDTRQIQDQQYQEQLKARFLQEKMYQATIGERPLQDKQYALNKQMFGVQMSISEQSQKIAEATTAIAEAELPYNQRIRHAQTRQTIRSAQDDRRLFQLQEKQGQLTNAVADLNAIFGALSGGFNKNIKTGNDAIIAHLPEVARDMGVSVSLLRDIKHLLGGGFHPTGGGPPGPGPWQWTKGIANTLAPWNWPSNIQTGVDTVHHGLNSLGVPGPLSTIGGIGAGILGVGAAGAISKVAISRGLMGGLVMPRLGRRLAGDDIADLAKERQIGGSTLRAKEAWAIGSEERGLLGGIRGVVGTMVTNWGKLMRDAAPLSLLTRPMLSLYQSVGKLAGAGAGFLGGSVVPGAGHILGASIGQDVGEKAVAERGMAQGSGPLRGRFLLTRYLGRTIHKVVLRQWNGLTEAFNKSLIRGVGRLAITPLKLPFSLAGQGLRDLGNLGSDWFSGVKGRLGDISKPVVTAANDTGFIERLGAKLKAVKGTIAEPSAVVALSADKAGPLRAYAAPQLSNDASDIRRVANLSKLETTRGGVVLPSDVSLRDAGAKGPVTTESLMADIKSSLSNSVNRLKSTADSFHTAVTKDSSARTTNVANEAKNVGASQKASVGQQRAAQAEGHAARVSGEASKDAKEGGSLFRTFTGRFGGFIRGFGSHMGTFGRYLGRFGAVVGIFDLIPDKWKEAIASPFKAFHNFFNDHMKGPLGDFANGLTKFIKDGIEKFTGAVGDFVKSIGGLVGKLADFFGLHLPGTPGGGESAAARRAGQVGEDSATALRKGGKGLGSVEGAAEDPASRRLAAAGATSSVTRDLQSLTTTSTEDRSAFKEALTKFGDKLSPIARAAGFIMKWGGRVAAVASFVPAVDDLAHGRVGSALGNTANAASYLTAPTLATHLTWDVLKATGAVKDDQSREPQMEFLRRMRLPAGSLGKDGSFTDKTVGAMQGSLIHGAQQMSKEDAGLAGKVYGGQYVKDMIGANDALRKGDLKGYIRYYQQALKDYDNFRGEYHKKFGEDKGRQLAATFQFLGRQKKAYETFNQLDLNQQQDYWKNRNVDQRAAQDALLRGPHGVQAYLRDVNALTHTGLDKLVKTHNFNLDQLTKIYDSWHSLSRTQQRQFMEDFQKDQKGGLQALLKGPQGVQAYLDGQTKGFSNFFDQAVKGAGDWMKGQGQSLAQGASQTNTITTNWLNGLTKQIVDWSKNNGVDISAKPIGKTADVANSVAAGALGAISPWSNNIAFAHGGVVEADQHSVGMDKGRIVRMVEEGHPEVVIPLAPHRRERAKSLLHQTAGMIGMADGGTIDAHHHTGHKSSHPFRPGGFYLPDGAFVSPKEAATHHTDKLKRFAAGGYVFPFSPAPEMWERTDMGVDFSLAAGTKIGPIGRARVGPQASWGQYGPYVEWQLLDGPRAGQWAYVAEGITNIASAGAIVNANQAVATATHGPFGIEYGWGTSTPGQTLASATTGYREGEATAAGTDMRNFLTGLTHGQIIGGGAPGSPAASIPPIHLKDVPKALRGQGVVGSHLYKILQKYKKKWEKKLDSMSGSSTGSLGALTGHLNGPAWFVKAVQETDNISANSGGGKYGPLTGYSEFPSHLGTAPTAANPGVDGLGGIPGMTLMRIAANGKVVTAPKVDEGSGSLGGEWTSPPQLVMGLYPAVSNALGLSGGGPYRVGIQRVDGQALHPAAAYGPENVAKHLGGLPRVPRDNYLAMLHQGEAVVQSGEVNARMSGKSNISATGQAEVQKVLVEIKSAFHALGHGGFGKKDRGHLETALNKVEKANLRLEEDIKTGHLKHIKEDISEVKNTVAKLHDVERKMLLMQLDQQVKGVKPKLDAQVAKEIAQQQSKYSQFHGSPFGGAGQQSSNLITDLTGKLHNLKGPGGKFVSLQDERIERNKWQLQLDKDLGKDHKKIANDKKKLADDLHKHADQKKIDADRKALGADTKSVSVDRGHLKKLDKQMAHQEDTYMKWGMNHGISKNMLSYAWRHVGQRDNQGMFSDAQLANIPSALLAGAKAGKSYQDPGYDGRKGTTVSGGPGLYVPPGDKKPPKHGKGQSHGGSSSTQKSAPPPPHKSYSALDHAHRVAGGQLHIGSHVGLRTNVDWAHRIYDHLIHQKHSNAHKSKPHKKSKTPEQILKALKAQDKNLTKRIDTLKKTHEKVEKQHEKILNTLHKSHMKTIGSYHKEISKYHKEHDKRDEKKVKEQLKNLEKHWKTQEKGLKGRWKVQDKHYEIHLKTLEKQRSEVRKHEKVEEKAIEVAKKARAEAHKQRQDHNQSFNKHSDRQGQHQQKIEHHFNTMVNHLGQISDKVHKLNPNVQNNINVEVTGLPASKTQVTVKPQRNR